MVEAVDARAIVLRVWTVGPKLPGELRLLSEAQQN